MNRTHAAEWQAGTKGSIATRQRYRQPLHFRKQHCGVEKELQVTATSLIMLCGYNMEAKTA
jgi:hypothetical protein